MRLLLYLGLLCIGTLCSCKHSKLNTPPRHTERNAERNAERNTGSDVVRHSAGRPWGGSDAAAAGAVVRQADLPLVFEKNVDSRLPDVQYTARGPGYAVLLSASEARLWLIKEGLHAADAPDLRPERHNVVEVRMRAQGGCSKTRSDAGLHAEEAQSGQSHYFIGSAPQAWRTGVTQYGQVRHQNIYPGIDLVYHGKARQLEYDWIVAPGADPACIELGFDGMEHLSMGAQGELVLHTQAGAVMQHKPVIYQEIKGQKKYIQGRYIRKGPRSIGFDVGPYDRRRELIIDPVLSYSSYLGGTHESRARAMAVDKEGNIYMAGSHVIPLFPFWKPPPSKADFPMQGTVLTLGDIAFNRPNSTYRLTTSSIGVIAKFDKNGTLIYSTYLGGDVHEEILAMAVDDKQQIYVTGYTFSGLFFPVTPDAQRPTKTGSVNAASNNAKDAFISKISADGGTLIYSSHLGGDLNTEGHAVAVNQNEEIFITGFTNATDFVVVNGERPKGAIQNDYAFVTKLHPDGSYAYSTYLGGTRHHDIGRSIVVDKAGYAYVTGDTKSSDFPITEDAYQPEHGMDPKNPHVNTDAFIVKLSPQGAFIYSTFLGGGENDEGRSIAIDPQGNIYITGTMASRGFKMSENAYQKDFKGQETNSFIAKLRPIAPAHANSARRHSVPMASYAVDYLTYLGGTFYDEARSIQVDARGHAYVAGVTYSSDFPKAGELVIPTWDGNVKVLSSALRSSPLASPLAAPLDVGADVRMETTDIFVFKLNSEGTASDYSVTLHGENVDDVHGMALDAQGHVYIGGGTYSHGFPTTADAYQARHLGSYATMFVSKISPSEDALPRPPGDILKDTFCELDVSPKYESVAGEPVVLMAYVQEANVGHGPAENTDSIEGEVVFTDGGLSLSICGKKILVAGQALCKLGDLSEGPHELMATYLGQGLHQKCSSTKVQHRVKAKPRKALDTTTHLEINPKDTSYLGDFITFKASVSTVDAMWDRTLELPQGKVAFKSDQLLICSADLDKKGEARCKRNDLPIGPYQVIAYYLGSELMHASSSEEIPHRILTRPAPPPRLPTDPPPSDKPAEPQPKNPPPSDKPSSVPDNPSPSDGVGPSAPRPAKEGCAAAAGGAGGMGTLAAVGMVLGMWRSRKCRSRAVLDRAEVESRRSMLQSANTHK